MVKVAVVGDRCSYALQLSRAVNSILQVRCLFYGPKRPTGKIVEFSGFENYEPVWTTYGYFLQILIRALRDRPHIIHFDFTLTTFGGSYLSSLPLPFLVTLLKLFGFKVVVTVHDVITKHVLRELYGTRTIRNAIVWITALLFYRFLSLSSVFIVHLKVLKRMLVTMCCIDPQKIFVIPFGVEEIPVIPGDRLNFWARKFRDTKILLFFGVIAPRKGIEYLIEGFSLIADSCPDSYLVIAGPTYSKSRSYLDNLLKKVPQLLNGKRFVYLGCLKEDDAHSLLKLCRVVVLPYVYTYASPSILYWAIQHHKPVIASRISTLSEELEGYFNTLLVRPRDSKQIASALERILTNNDLAAKASRFMALKASSLSWRNVAKSICEIYDLTFCGSGK